MFELDVAVNGSTATWSAVYSGQVTVTNKAKPALTK